MSKYLRVLTLVLINFGIISLSSCFGDNNSSSEETNKVPDQNNDTNKEEDETEEELVLLNSSDFLGFNILGLDKYDSPSGNSSENEYLIDSNKLNYEIELNLNNPNNYKISEVLISDITYKNESLDIKDNNSNIKIQMTALPDFGFQTYEIESLKYQVKDEEHTLYLNSKYTLNYPHVHEVFLKDFVLEEASSSANLTFEIVDEDNILRNMDLVYSLYLDGESNPFKTNKNLLKVGKNSLKLTDLDEFSKYEIKFSYEKDFTSYGGRKIFYTFFTKTFNTTKSIELTNFVPSYNSVTFENHTAKDVTIDSIILKYKDVGGTLKTLENNVTSISNLYSNTDYEIQVFYKIKDRTLTKSFYFKTLAYNTPTINVIKLESDKTSISYEVEINDQTNNGELTVLLTGTSNTEVKVNDLTFTFTSLKTDTFYSLRFIYKYDLLDNKGTKSIEVFKGIKTKAVSMDEISFNVSYLDSNEISYDFDYGTRSDVTFNKISLINSKGEEIKSITTNQSGTFTSGSFRNNQTYTLKAVFDVSFNDSLIRQEISKTVFVPKLKTPTVTLNTTSTKSSIGYEIVLDDPSNIVNVTLIELYDGENKVEHQENNLKGSFSSLNSDKTYTLKVRYIVKYNEASLLVKNEILEKEVKTLAKSAPVLSLDNVKIGSDTFSATLNVLDPDGVYFNNPHNYFKLTNINNKQDYHSSATLNFEGITPNATYKLTYNYYYDFKEGEGKVTKTFEYSFTTLNKIRINSFKITPPNFESSKYIFEIDFKNPNFLQLIGFTINGKLYTPKESFRNSPIEIVIEDASIFEVNKNNVFTISSVSYYYYDNVTTLECIGNVSASILIGPSV